MKKTVLILLSVAATLTTAGCQKIIVEGKPLYYMDYTAKVDWECLLTQPKDNHFSFPCLRLYMDKVSMALFGTVPNGDVSNPGGSCSGFICYNNKGALLKPVNRKPALWDCTTWPLQSAQLLTR